MHRWHVSDTYGKYFFKSVYGPLAYVLTYTHVFSTVPVAVILVSHPCVFAHFQTVLEITEFTV